MSEHNPNSNFDFPDDPLDGTEEEASDEVEVDRGGSAEDVAAPGIALFRGTDLNADEARMVMAGSLCQMIVLAGMPDAGKTTLLATLYELFLRGPFAGYLFAASRTQLGFDERCHKARMASQRITPDTERTMPSAVGYLHVAVREESLENPIRHLLITDISGETFRDQVRNSTADTQALGVLRRADHFALLIDAEQLAKLSARQRTVTDARLVLRSCIESGMVGMSTHVQIVYSRWDVVATGEATGAIEKFLVPFESSLREWETSVAGLTFHTLASRPTSKRLPIGYGVEPLLRAWTEVTERARAPGSHHPTPLAEDREITRFLWRERLMVGTEEIS